MHTSLLVLASMSLGLLSACGSTSVETGSSGTGGATSSTTSSSTSGTGGAAPCVDPAGPATFEIGTGETCFERLTPMQTVPTIQGPQGGYHVWLAFGCADCNAKATVDFGVKDPATHDWFAGTGDQKLVADLPGEGWRQRAGYTAFLPGIVWDPKSSLPKGSHVILTAAILDDAQQPIHTAEVEVVLGDLVQWAGPPCDPGPMCGAPGGLPCCLDGKQN